MDSKDYQRVFEQSSLSMVIVKPDYSVSAVSEGFLKVTGNVRENITGRSVFDVFPKSLPHIESVLINTMRESFNNVIKHKNSETTPIVRYDIPKNNSGEDGFDVRYWKAINTPILDENENVVFIKQIFVDVTNSDELASLLELEKENLDEFKTAERYISNIFSQAPSPICVFRGPEHLIEMTNSTFSKFATSDKIIGKPAHKVLTEFKGQGFFETLDEVYHNEKSLVGSDKPINIKNQENGKQDAFFDFVFQVLFDPSGKKVGVFVLGTEVTSLIQAKKSTEESEERYRTLIEESPIATALYTGPNLIVEYVNDIMLDYWGKKEAIGKPLLEVVPELENQNFIGYLKKVLKTGKEYSGIEEKAELIKDGKLQSFYFNFKYKAIQNENGIYGIHHTAIDVTEEVVKKKALQEREETMKLLLDSMPQKISHTDNEGDVVFFNQQWIDETGYALEDLKGKKWAKTIHPEDLEQVKNAWENALDSGSVFEVECRIIHKDNGYRWNLNRAVPVRDNNGKIRMWVGSNTDIHEQKKQKELLEQAVSERTKELERANEELLIQNLEKERQKEELEVANKELKTVNKELESFAYVSSHDLQEPLRKIQIFAGRIREKEHQNLSDKGRDYFHRIQESANRMRILIDDLLSFSKVTNNDKEFERIDLTAIIEDVKDEFKEIIEENNATIKVTEICDAKVIIFQFRQLIKNLISNSIKFSKPGTPAQILITSREVHGSELTNEKLSKDIKYCHMIFKDNGIGFDPGFRDRIFEVFQRLHNRDQYAGTGIGLAIVKKIVENHNGIITVESQPNEGTRFDIFIPSL